MAKENNQLITIGIPLYNMENSICNAIDSCLNQTYKNFEILIVDDKSTDNGVKVIEEKYKKEIKEGKIRIYKRKKKEDRQVHLHQEKYSMKKFCEGYQKILRKVCGK